MEKYTLTQITPNTHILESDSIDALLINPGRKLLGLRRMNTAFQATTTWCRALLEQNFLPKNPRDVCTMTILAEGIGHNLPAALATALAPHHHRGDNFLGVSRFALPKNENDAYTPFDARVKYLRLESPAPVWVMLDTIATGATLVRGLEAAFNNAPDAASTRDKSVSSSDNPQKRVGASKPEHILLGTPAGSWVGAKKIAELCARENVQLTLFFFGAIFGLWHDGTALPWCHPKTIFSGTPRGEKNRALTARIFDNIEGFCSVGDCSANFFDVVEAEKILQAEQGRFGWRLLHE